MNNETQEGWRERFQKALILHLSDEKGLWVYKEDVFSFIGAELAAQETAFKEKLREAADFRLVVHDANVQEKINEIVELWKSEFFNRIAAKR